MIKQLSGDKEIPWRSDWLAMGGLPWRSRLGFDPTAWRKNTGCRPRSNYFISLADMDCLYGQRQ